MPSPARGERISPATAALPFPPPSPAGKPWTGLLCALLVSTTGPWAAAAGTTAAGILRIENGARGLAMGGAYAGLARDVAGGLHWNPGGLGFIHANEAEAAYDSLHSDMNHGYLAGGHNFGRYGGVAAGISYLDMPPIILTQSDPAGGFTMTGSVRPWARVIAAGYGWSPSSSNLGLGAGAIVKLVEESIINDKESAAAFDVGVLARPLGDMVSLGVALQNLGGRSGLGGYRLPQLLRTGLGFELASWAAAVDLVVGSNEPVNLRAGAEYLLRKTLALRIGFDSSMASDLGKYGGIQAGLSAGLGMKIHDYQLDYAFMSAGDLGATHRFTLSARWGGQARRKRADDGLAQGGRAADGRPEAAAPPRPRQVERMEQPSAPGLATAAAEREPSVAAPEPAAEPTAAPPPLPAKAPQPKHRPVPPAPERGSSARALLDSLAAAPRGSQRRGEILGLLLSRASDLRPLGRQAVGAVNAVLDEEFDSPAATNANKLLAIRLIGAIGDRETGRTVQTCIFHADPEVAAEAAQALAAAGAKGSLEALQNAVNQLDGDAKYATPKGQAMARKMRSALDALRK